MIEPLITTFPNFKVSNLSEEIFFFDKFAQFSKLLADSQFHISAPLDVLLGTDITL